ncbi:MAG: hypothetical protein KME43_06020 [Myxacorys chilensis ATA2-1-KO14]|nr:hypothetical protein [Myxacorys chilensis ATA2-1-KO14]
MVGATLQPDSFKVSVDSRGETWFSHADVERFYVKSNDLVIARMRLLTVN